MDETSTLIPVKSKEDANDTDENNEHEKNKSSFFSRLYYQTIGIQLKPSVILLDKNESYKRLHRDRLIKTLVYLCDLITNYCLPYRLSPMIIPIPGFLLQVTLFILVHTTCQLTRFHYAFWFVLQYLIYALDMIDGKQARRNGTQSLARHFWDHGFDILDTSLASLILLKLYPFGMNYRLPSIVLLLVQGYEFYKCFIVYYCTGILIERFTAHMWYYIYVSFLSFSVFIFNVDVLNNKDYQIALATLSIVLIFGIFLYLLDDIYYVSKSPMFSIKLCIIILLSPCISVAVYVIIDYYKNINIYLPDMLFYRASYLVVIASYNLDIHYHQLINESPSLITIELLIYILSLFTILIHNSIANIVLMSILIFVLLLVTLIKFTIRLRVLIKMYPDIGFPILIVNGNNNEYHNNITNNK